MIQIQVLTHLLSPNFSSRGMRGWVGGWGSGIGGDRGNGRRLRYQLLRNMHGCCVAAKGTVLAVYRLKMVDTIFLFIIDCGFGVRCEARFSYLEVFHTVSVR